MAQQPHVRHDKVSPVRDYEGGLALEHNLMTITHVTQASPLGHSGESPGGLSRDRLLDGHLTRYHASSKF